MRHCKHDMTLEYTQIYSTFKAFLRQYKLNADYAKKVKQTWWHGFHHGLVLIGLTAPLAWVQGVKRIFISSTHSYKDYRFNRAASHPSLDESIRFFGARVTHYDYTVSRQEKVRFICQQKRILDRNISLRVCWEQRTGINCCKCEKCLRTIFAIYAENMDPNMFGFNITDTIMKDILAIMENDLEKMGLSVTWGDIAVRLEKSKYSSHLLVKSLLETDKMKKMRKKLSSKNKTSLLDH
jgi:hypothetical protein